MRHADAHLGRPPGGKVELRPAQGQQVETAARRCLLRQGHGELSGASRDQQAHQAARPRQYGCLANKAAMRALATIAGLRNGGRPRLRQGRVLPHPCRRGAAAGPAAAASRWPAPGRSRRYCARSRAHRAPMPCRAPARRVRASEIHARNPPKPGAHFRCKLLSTKWSAE